MPDDVPPRTPTRPSGPPHAARPHAARPGDPGLLEPAKPPITPEERERGRIVGLAALGAAVVVAVVVTIGIFIPALGALFSNAPTPVDASALPTSIVVCDVEYALVSATPERLDAARVRAGAWTRSSSGSAGRAPTASASATAPAWMSCSSRRRTTGSPRTRCRTRPRSRSDALAADLSGARRPVALPRPIPADEPARLRMPRGPSDARRPARTPSAPSGAGGRPPRPSRAPRPASRSCLPPGLVLARDLDAGRRVVDGRDRAQAAGLVVGERLDHLVAGVHHERAHPGDRLADRPAAQDEHVERRAFECPGPGPPRRVSASPGAEARRAGRSATDGPRRRRCPCPART